MQIADFRENLFKTIYGKDINELPFIKRNQTSWMTYVFPSVFPLSKESSLI